MKPKILGLELLRGLCALAVAIYHCLIWAEKAQLYTWGLYGVYTFFAISGAVLYANYSRSIPDGTVTIPSFLWKRFARLAPLLWACILVPAAIRLAWEPERYFLNLSMLQGFADPGTSSYLVGQWSLGIEVVLYALFPTLLALTTSWRIALAALAVLLGLRFAFCEFALDPQTLVDAWGTYTETAAFLCFFFGGMLIAKANLTGWHAGVAGLIAAACIFGFPGGNATEVLTGWRGAGITLASLVLVAGCLWSPSGVGAAVCKFFGDVSYGLYLLHPIVWHGLGKFSMSAETRIALTLLVTTVVAWLSYRLYETPVRKRLVHLGRTVHDQAVVRERGQQAR